jgi:hypothetical protein
MGGKKGNGKQIRTENRAARRKYRQLLPGSDDNTRRRQGRRQGAQGIRNGQIVTMVKGLEMVEWFGRVMKDEVRDLVASSLEFPSATRERGGTRAAEPVWTGTSVRGAKRARPFATPETLHLDVRALSGAKVHHNSSSLFVGGEH